MSITALRQAYHRMICQEIIRTKPGKRSYLNFADGSSRTSVQVAASIAERIGYHDTYTQLMGQTAGARFEQMTVHFLEQAFTLLQNLRPGEWSYVTNAAISMFDQYAHLATLEKIVTQHPELASSLGQDYVIKPDIIIARIPISNEERNRHAHIVDETDAIAQLTPLREENTTEAKAILHASISCKWTLRSDRGQNTRTEALNLIRNRKGHTPHIIAVTAEPLPSRIASLALGTGDLDCIYHFALYELEAALKECDNEDQLDMLYTLLNGRRLRDISDLPFDLAI